MYARRRPWRISWRWLVLRRRESVIKPPEAADSGSSGTLGLNVLEITHMTYGNTATQTRSLLFKNVHG